MLDHVTVCAADFAISLEFYDAALGALGLTRVFELGDEEEDEPGVEVAAFGVGGTAQVWLVGGTTDHPGCASVVPGDGPLGGRGVPRGRTRGGRHEP